MIFLHALCHFKYQTGDTLTHSSFMENNYTKVKHMCILTLLYVLTELVILRVITVLILSTINVTKPVLCPSVWQSSLLSITNFVQVCSSYLHLSKFTERILSIFFGTYHEDYIKPQITQNWNLLKSKNRPSRFGIVFVVVFWLVSFVLFFFFFFGTDTTK